MLLEVGPLSTTIIIQTDGLVVDPHLEHKLKHYDKL